MGYNLDYFSSCDDYKSDVLQKSAEPAFEREGMYPGVDWEGLALYNLIDN